MITRSHRFHGYTSLSAAYRRGSVVRGPQLSLRYMERPRGSYRVAVVVSRKVSKSAVVRNRIRRRLYELVRARSGRLGNYDLIFTVFSDQLTSAPPAKLAAIIDDLLVKVSRPDDPGHAIVNSEKRSS